MYVAVLVLVSIVSIGLKICDAQENPAPCGEYDTSQQGKVLNFRLMIKCHRNNGIKNWLDIKMPKIKKGLTIGHLFHYL